MKKHMKKILTLLKTRWLTAITFMKTQPTVLAFIIAFVATAIFLTLGYSEIVAVDRQQPINEIIRNYGILVFAFWGIALAVWRGQIAEKQAETSERGFRNERYQRGANMLGSETFSTRMGGLRVLEYLARNHPEDYLDQIIELIAAFVRSPSQGEKEWEERPETDVSRRFNFRFDVQRAIRVITVLNDFRIKRGAEKDEEGSLKTPNLTLANLSYMYFTSDNPILRNFTNFDFTSAQLEHARFTNTNLTNVRFWVANLTNAELVGANLTNAELISANLVGADISDADISSTNLSKAKGLTQEQLDSACQYPEGEPPKLPTGEVFTWDEEAAKERWRQCHGDSTPD